MLQPCNVCCTIVFAGSLNSIRLAPNRLFDTDAARRFEQLALLAVAYGVGLMVMITMSDYRRLSPRSGCATPPRRELLTELLPTVEAAR